MSGPGCRTGLGPLPLIEGITLTVSASGQEWITSFSKAGQEIAEDKAAALPWVDRRAPGRLAALLHQAVPTLDQKAAKDALLEVFETIKSSPDTPGIVSEAAARVIGETVAVRIEKSVPPVYVVDLEGGHDLVFEAREIAARRPIVLNERWLSAHPTTPLRATSKDFDEIVDYWMSIGEVVEPTGCACVWEGISEMLQDRIGQLSVHPDPEGLIRSGLYLDGDNVLWVSNGLIGDILRRVGKDGGASQFAQYLKRAGHLIHNSRTIRAGGRPRRAWGFRYDFRPTDPTTVDFASLVVEEEGQL